ncbi:hypothetical protein P3T73_07900 [Kiritimatiellota bacterium B12222]|nr:hypothetical protein P3T73_07900 [Kiritimatiellota bacterium B12222]
MSYFSKENSECSQVYAVLTGDVMGSRQLSASQLQDLLAGMKDFWGKFSTHSPDQVIGTLEVFRGDGWQVALKSPACALEAAVFLRAVCKACPASDNSDSRVGIGMGSVDVLNPSHLAESQGDAFEASGDALAVAAQGKIRWKLLSKCKEVAKWDALTLPPLDLAISSWSSTESFAVVGEILGWTQEETALHPWAQKTDGSSPTPQAVGKAFRRTHWKSHISPVLDTVNEIFNDENNL